MTTATNENLVLRLERVFKASPDRVYRAWTNPAQVVKWWGPEGFTIPVHDFDVAVGGSYCATMKSPEGSEHTVSGVFKELVPNRRVVLSWAWVEDGVRGHETTVCIELEARGDDTLLRLEQRVFETEDSRDQHNHGWCSSLNKLDGALH